MQSGFRSLICGLCCFAGVMATGPTTPAEVKAMPAVLDNFDQLLGNQGDAQNCIGAAKGIIVNNNISKAHLGKGYWYSYADADGSSIVGADGVTPITDANFTDLKDTTTANRFLKGKFIVTTSSNDYPYAGIGCDLTDSKVYTTDLSKMTALSLKIGGSGSVRVFFKTEDYKAEDWGYYGYDITLTATAKTVSIPVASLKPGEGSTGETKKWTWAHGAATVGMFHIQNIDATEDISFTVDDITIVGMTYADFGWVTSIITGKTTQFCTKPLTVSNSRINYSVTQPQNITIGLYNALGSRVATLFNGNVASGNYSIPMKSNVANGNYFVKLTGEQGTAVQPLTIAK
jgi:hypothetical protein